ncbi:MAG: hypothetical protein LC115_08130 [Bacteroidia bacterium]|nr:hypothetical protein [Bacteroidia bacterium]
MSTEIITAVIAAVVALISAIVTITGQTRTARLEHELTLQRDAQSKETKNNELVAKYRNPILKSAFDLQSRLFGIVQLGFLQIYYYKSPTDKEYATQHTLYVIAEYLGWIEIFRREVQFLDFGDLKTSQQLEKILSNISSTFLTDGFDLTFRLFRGQQQAIGEIMTVKSEINSGKHECMGFSDFVKRLDEPEFQRWFIKLSKDVEVLSNEPKGHERRLIILQHLLIDLIDFLDPECIRIPQSKRYKIESTRDVQQEIMQWYAKQNAV